ncbi:MAG: DUF948 domain-containing protein [Silvanigrellaceae bacterium]|nr:DUF948 domain-containing protein [Silvanigrellaceae bacterium]
MTLEIIASITGVAFIAIAISVIITLKRVRNFIKKTDSVLKEVQNTLRSLSEPSIELIHDTNKLILDVKKKSESLDPIFHPLYNLKKERSEGPKGFEKICDLLGYVSEGIQLFSKIKDEIKR